MFEAFSKAQWKRTLPLLVVCGVLAAAAGVVGIDDNTVGGSLAWLSAIALVLAFAHPWRTTRRFLVLAGASVVAFVALLVIFGTMAGADIDLGALGTALGTVVFYILIFLCPAGFVVGLIGAVVTWATSRRGHRVPPVKPVA